METKSECQQERGQLLLGMAMVTQPRVEDGNHPYTDQWEIVAVRRDPEVVGSLLRQAAELCQAHCTQKSRRRINYKEF